MTKVFLHITIPAMGSTVKRGGWGALPGRLSSILIQKYLRLTLFILLGVGIFLHLFAPSSPLVIPNENETYENPTPRPVKPPTPIPSPPNLKPQPLPEKSQPQTQPQNTYKPEPKRIKYIYYRAIGNDLPPRHALGQTLTNVQYMLDNEPVFPEMEKRWLVNRIVDPEQERKVIALLESRKQIYLHVPINITEYAKRNIRYEGFGVADILRSDVYHNATDQRKVEIVDAMLHDKNLYVMHNNGARNMMLEDGIKAGAEWILPFDGNCFMTRTAWEEIKSALERKGSESKYFVTPMARLQSNDQLSEPGFRPEATEEPQIIFRHDAKERFSPNMRYGRRPKVELLWRLAVPGPWEKWPQSIGPWEKKEWTISDDVPLGGVPTAGWIPRLYSGQGALEKAGTIVNRGISRSQGVESILSRLDVRVAEEMYGFKAGNLLAWNESVLQRERDAYRAKSHPDLVNLVNRKMLKCADAALKFGPFSVTHKKNLPPSDDPHDYYTPSPYFWPDPKNPKAPYKRHDGKRVPGTLLYDEQSENYDRSRLASLFGNTTCLALGWYFTERNEYAVHAAENIRTWFLRNETRMNPHMRYAQIRWGHDNNVGANYGIIETKDLYFLLDAVRLVERSGALSPDESVALKAWLREFVTYLLESKQGLDEYYTANNHGVYYDIQIAAIAAYIGDMDLFFRHTERAKGRALWQFAPDGSLPEEMSRKTQLHYMMFGLQGWYTLATLSQRAGVDLWGFKASSDRTPFLYRGAKFTVPQFNVTWTNHQVDREDMGRMYPLYYAAAIHYPNLVNETQASLKYPRPTNLYALKPDFNAHDGIMPYWNLGLTLMS
eukprot:comp23923_c0_seq1/m.42223 comp23923_c0_seq1/g.42223  ORF comp23923_c0_seq1/g.42223 comp23923_c0_seq1/m.42223 type:complete len:833 (-) comp23923_c0_seq1:38-2536(-)